jgi:hypothetical protein
MDKSTSNIETIRTLVHTYADAVTHHDTARWADTWATDGVWEIGRGARVGRESIVSAFESAMVLFSSVVHLVGSGEASFDGATGRGRWYMTEYARTVKGKAVFYAGYYDDEYKIESGCWRFASRELTWLYQGAPDLSGEFGLFSK